MKIQTTSILIELAADEKKISAQARGLSKRLSSRFFAKQEMIPRNFSIHCFVNLLFIVFVSTVYRTSWPKTFRGTIGCN